jgi:hypothetical protein
MTVAHKDYSYSLAVNPITLTPNGTHKVLLGAWRAPFEVHSLSLDLKGQNYIGNDRIIGLLN